MCDSHTVMQITHIVFVLICDAAASLSHFSTIFKSHESHGHFYAMRLTHRCMTHEANGHNDDYSTVSGQFKQLQRNFSEHFKIP